MGNCLKTQKQMKVKQVFACIRGLFKLSRFSAMCLLDINYGKERLHIRVGRIEIDLDRCLVKPCLTFV